MRKGVIVLCVVACLLGTSAKVFAQVGRYIVTARAPLGKAVEAVGGRVVHQFHMVPGLAVELPEVAVKQLRANPAVVSVEPDVVVNALSGDALKRQRPGTDRRQPGEVIEWNVDRIDAELVWSLSTGAGVKVAVVDTGIDRDHPDLVANIAGGVNFVRKGNSLNPDRWDDDNGHGTHVAGIIAAVDNEIGVVGVAPGARLYAVKVLDASGSGWLSDVVAAVEWSVDNRMDVINMSLGASSGSPLLEGACQAAAEAGIVIVAAAGNDGGPVLYPARYSSVIAVGATDSSDSVPWWSNRGPELEIVAPGVNVRSTWKGGGYRTLSGTSMAAPHVTGVCALMLALSPPPADPRAQLQGTADDLYSPGRDEISGFGLVDADEAAAGLPL